jgi:hypothetical protein
MIEFLSSRRGTRARIAFHKVMPDDCDLPVDRFVCYQERLLLGFIKNFYVKKLVSRSSFLLDLIR